MTVEVNAIKIAIEELHQARPLSGCREVTTLQTHTLRNLRSFLRSGCSP